MDAICIHLPKLQKKELEKYLKIIKENTKTTDPIYVIMDNNYRDFWSNNSMIIGNFFYKSYIENF